MTNSSANDVLWDVIIGLLETIGGVPEDSDDDQQSRQRHVSEAVMPALLTALKQTDESSRRTYASMLRLIHDIVENGADDRAVDACMAALKDPNVHLQTTAVKLLGWLGGEKSIPALREALRSSEETIRINAVEALGRIGHDSAVRDLQTALRDPSADVRYVAAWALGRTGNAAAIPELVTTLEDSVAEVRRMAARALGWIGDAAAVTGLLDSINDERSGVRRDVAQALGKIGSAAATDGLLSLLTDKRAVVRYSAAWALGQIGNPVAVQDLIQAIRDEDGDVRQAAAEALNLIGDMRALPALISALRDAQELDRHAEAYTVGLALYDMLTASIPVEAHQLGSNTMRHVDPITQVDQPVGPGMDSDGYMSLPELLNRIDQLIEDVPEARHLDRTKHSEPTEIDKPGLGKAPEPAFQLETTSGKIIALRRTSVIVGRGNKQGEENGPDIDLDELDVEFARTASRQHCRFTIQGETCTIEDMGSLNGTTLNGRKLKPEQPAPLKEGDTITLGDVEFTLKISHR